MTSFSPYFDPTSLFAGEGPYRHRAVTIGEAAAPLEYGTLLGRQSIGALTSAAKTGGNTGNGTCTPDATTPTLANSQVGTYKALFTTATAFQVTDPKGNEIGTGVVGTPFADEIKFEIVAGGTAFVAGDEFLLTAAAADRYILSKATATDGSQVPCAVVAAYIDTTGGDATGPCYFEGEFAVEKMTFDTSWSVQTLQAALRQNNIPIFARVTGTLG